MSITVDFYFDFGSPTAYLAYKRLQQLKQQYTFEINYKPVLLGGIFKASDNQSPMANPAKGAYMLTHDLPRFAERYNVPLSFNPFFPINTLPLMRGAHAAIEEDCFEAYVDVLYNGLWQQELNLGDAEVIASTLEAAGLDADKLMALTQQQHIKDALIATTEEAVARGAFGAPTMYIDDEMFFGQDRIDFIEERLKS
ncbi:MAG: 2-hydroxychromene-2-carboxylate isomerase [Pseudomonadales bacterium]|jgi:2-hydroxychromene-2-carboxylate isomerase